jgi:hypothetical protein
MPSVLGAQSCSTIAQSWSWVFISLPECRMAGRYRPNRKKTGKRSFGQPREAKALDLSFNILRSAVWEIVL